MAELKWIFAYGSVIGNSHLEDQLPCQDFCRIDSNEDFSICVVCDGAGSCENSHLGSEFVSQACLYHFHKELKSQDWQNLKDVPSSEFWHSVAKSAFFSTKEDLVNYSINLELPFKSLSCTVIVVVAMGTTLFASHIGDGRAGYCNQDSEWSSLITPFRGSEANETVFITSDIWNDLIIDQCIESHVVPSGATAFCLLSDGCEKAAFECNLFDKNKNVYYDPNKPYSPFFNKNVAALPMLFQQGKTQEEVNSLWCDFLTNGNDKLKNEPDDKTLILAVLNRNDSPIKRENA